MRLALANTGRGSTTPAHPTGVRCAAAQKHSRDITSPPAGAPAGSGGAGAQHQATDSSCADSRHCQACGGMHMWAAHLPHGSALPSGCNNSNQHSHACAYHHMNGTAYSGHLKNITKSISLVGAGTGCNPLARRKRRLAACAHCRCPCRAAAESYSVLVTHAPRLLRLAAWQCPAALPVLAVQACGARMDGDRQQRLLLRAAERLDDNRVDVGM